MTRDIAPDNSSNPTRDVDFEADMRRALDMAYQNVRNIDIAVQALFKNSMLAKRYKTLDIQTLENAARAQLLWTYPGVVLDPKVPSQLKDLQQYICRYFFLTIKQFAVSDSVTY